MDTQKELESILKKAGFKKRNTDVNRNLHKQKEKQMDTQVLLDKLTRAIAFKFKEDKTVPGLTVAALKKGYYCSIIRYSGAFAKGKIVVCSTRGNTLEAALKGVAEKFLTTTKVSFDPMQELNEAVRDIKLNG